MELPGTAERYSTPQPFGPHLLVATGGRGGGLLRVQLEGPRVRPTGFPGGWLAVHGEKAILHGEDGTVYLLDTRLRERARLSLQRTALAPPTLIPGERPLALLTTASDGVFAVDLNDLKVRWKLDLEVGFRAPAAGALCNGQLILALADRNGTVLRVDPQGDILWQKQTGNAIWARPFILCGAPPLVIVANRDGNVYALNAENGQRVWTYNVGAPIHEGLIPGKTADGQPYIVYCAEGVGIQALLLPVPFLQWRSDLPSDCSAPPLAAELRGDKEPEIVFFVHGGLLHTLTGGNPYLRFLDLVQLPGKGLSAPIFLSDQRLLLFVLRGRKPVQDRFPAYLVALQVASAR